VRDGDIRAALRTRLQQEHADDERTKLIDELGLHGMVRVDVAVLNGSLSGYELKSDRDTLRRLPMQVEYYSRALDYATLVMGAQQHARHGAGVVPDWWGVIVATEDGCGRIGLSQVRPARPNPRLDPFTLAALLWRQEALDELTSRGLDAGVRTKPRDVLTRRLGEMVPVPELRDAVRARLHAREGWRLPPPRE
jgi:hypothetical protein